jgi:hypothetical protein
MKLRRNNCDSRIKIIAGSFIVVSVILALIISKYWLIFTLFVGLNLFQYGFSGFCPLNIILDKVTEK